jgi:predicted negative regulator of RcsB-dependent stress response
VSRKKSEHPETAEPFHEFESRGEKALDWVGENAGLVLGAVALLLLLAGGIGFYQKSRSSAESDAADALAKARDEYLVAMGGQPGAFEVPELANPAAGAAIRAEYAEQFQAVAEEHAGSAAAALARLEEGNLAVTAGDAAGALEIWRAALLERPGDDPFAGVLQQRIAQQLEADGDWAAAAEAYAAAGENAAYPFRYWSMAEGARCFAMADRPKAALELYARIQSEAPEMVLPEHLRLRLRELEVADPS